MTALAAVLTTSGCSFFRIRPGTGDAASAAHSATPIDQAAVTREPSQTVTDNLTDVPEAATPAAAATPGVTTTVVIADTAGQIAANAPKSYVVRRGDTLWGLAGMFLKDPWHWPEIWYMNPEVTNPHRIYPGDTLRLALGRDGREQLQVAHVDAGSATPVAPVASGGPITRLNPLLRSESLDVPIETIPYASIAAFLSRPALLTAAQVKAAPYIVALRDSHMVAGAGNDVYVRKLKAGQGARFNVMHITEPLKVPGHGTVGYIAQFAGVAEVKSPGDPARLTLTESARETLTGDVLIPEADNIVADIHPHRPRGAIDSRILAVINGVLLAGQFQVVAISGGTGEGVEPGHVLKAVEAVKSVRDRCARIQGSGSCQHWGDTRLPQESAGTLLVFRSYEHMSYALIASETVPLHIGDHVKTP
jgi:hypothetical protein